MLQCIRTQDGTGGIRPAFEVALLMKPTKTMRIAPPTAPPAKLPTQPSTAVPATALAGASLIVLGVLALTELLATKR